MNPSRRTPLDATGRNQTRYSVGAIVLRGWAFGTVAGAVCGGGLGVLLGAVVGLVYGAAVGLMIGMVVSLPCAVTVAAFASMLHGVGDAVVAGAFISMAWVALALALIGIGEPLAWAVGSALAASCGSVVAPKAVFHSMYAPDRDTWGTMQR